MATLGSPQTTDFSIGTAELRVGPMASANFLTQAHSVGLIDEATLTVTQESVDLEGKFPRTIVDTAIVRQSATISATLREYSRRNLNLMLGEGVGATAPTANATLVTTNEALGASSVTISVGTGANYAVDDLVVIYPEGRPQDVTVIEIGGIAVDVLTFKTNQVTSAAYDGTTETIHLFQAHRIPVGNVTKTNYFAATLLQKDNTTGAPKAYTFWKAATAGSLDFATNAEDFASMSMELKLLEPAAAEYGVGGDLEDIADLITGKGTKPPAPIGLLPLGA